MCFRKSSDARETVVLKANRLTTDTGLARSASNCAPARYWA